jgi:L-arabinose isomerase
VLEEIFGNSMPAVCTLTARDIPSSGEGDIMTAIMVKMTQLLTGNGSFCEYWNIDFDNDRVLVGHDGPANYRMAADTVSSFGYGQAR